MISWVENTNTLIKLKTGHENFLCQTVSGLINYHAIISYDQVINLLDTRNSLSNHIETNTVEKTDMLVPDKNIIPYIYLLNKSDNVWRLSAHHLLETS